MGALSKFFEEVLGLTVYKANCYEFGHTWTSGCFTAVMDAVRQSCFFSFKTYALVYFLEALLSSRPLFKDDIIRLLKDISRSSLFLVANVAAFLWFMCILRRLLGFYVLPTMGFVNGVISSYLSIFIESPRRRPMLALYLTNLASETAFRQLVNHGYLKSIPNGQVLVFALGIAGLVYFLRRKHLPQRLTSLLKFTHFIDDEDEVISTHTLHTRFPAIFAAAAYLRSQFPKHPLCKHRYSCLSRSTECFGKNFTVGCGIQLALYCAQNYRRLLFKPASFVKNLFCYRNLRLPLFLGTIPLLYQASRCILNMILNSEGDLAIRDAFCGGLSGGAMFLYPSTSIAMYILWKCIEVSYFISAKAGLAPVLPQAAMLLYAISTGYVLWNVVIEPKNLRRGYWDFIVNLTGHRVKLLNRRVLGNCCFQSTCAFPGLHLDSAVKANF